MIMMIQILIRRQMTHDNDINMKETIVSDDDININIKK